MYANSCWEWYENVLYLLPGMTSGGPPDFLATPGICHCGLVIIKLFEDLNYWYPIKNIHIGCGDPINHKVHHPNEVDTLFFRLDMGTPS